jgi:prepilin-type N-terminal cleavage/methylation domain-containing protein
MRSIKQFKIFKIIINDMCLSKTKNKHNYGFTLIELLVVIAIIGILSSVVLASLNGARLKGRNAKRLSDMRQIQIALEMYYNSNGSYPIGGGLSECNAWGGLAASNVIPGLVPTYIPSFPADPTMDKVANTSCYLYISNGTDYALIDHNIIDVGFSYASYPTFYDPARDGGSNGCIVDGSGFWAWKIYSPGGVCW